MFEQFKGFFKGVSVLIQQPTILDDYRNTLHNLRTTTQEDTDRLRRQNARLASELKFHQNMERLSVAQSKAYFDRTTGIFTVQGFKTDRDGVHYIDTDQGDITAEAFMRRLDEGTVVPLSTTQGPLPQSLADINKRLEHAGIMLHEVAGGLIELEDLRLEHCHALLGDWSSMEHLADSLDRDEVCGLIVCSEGDWSIYSDTESYLQAYEKELNCRGSLGVGTITITKDPTVHKAIDDLIYNEMGEDNPLGINFYREYNRGVDDLPMTTVESKATPAKDAPSEELEFEL